MFCRILILFMVSGDLVCGLVLLVLEELNVLHLICSLDWGSVEEKVGD